MADGPSIVSEERIGYAGWRVTATAGFGVFFASLVIVTFPVLLKPLSQEFSWSREEVSTAFAIGAGLAALCAAPVGFLLDRVDPRRIVVPCLAIFGCVFASLSLLTRNLGHLYASFAVLGAAGIGTSPVAYARVISTWFTTRRGLALALVVTGGALGGVLHPPVMEALIRRAGWRGACLCLGLAVLAVGVPAVARFARANPSRRTAEVAAAGTTIGGGLRSLRFWVLAGGMLGGTMVQNSVIVHLHAMLTDRGIDAAHAAIALSAMAVSAVAGRVVTGFLIDRMFAARVGIAMMALAAIGVGLLSDSPSFATGVLGAALVGFGTGGESDIVPYLLSRYFGLRSFSALYGLAWLAGGVGGGLGPVLMGRAFDRSGSYEGALVRLGVVAAAAAALMLLLPRDRAGPLAGSVSVEPS